jgi:hypothetical protein
MGSNGVAAMIDPQRNVDLCLAAAHLPVSFNEAQLV